MLYSTLARYFFFVCLSCFVVSTNGSKSSRILCSPGFTEDTEAESSPLCYRLFSEQVSWEQANKICMNEFSFLLNTEFFSTNDIKNLLRESIIMVYPGVPQGLKEIWIGIRRVAGFFAWQTSSPRIFTETRSWGNTWERGVTLSEDCVALNVTSGTLSTKSCTNELSFLCVNEGFPTQPVQLPLCPKNWSFTYHTDIRFRDPCVRIFPKVKFEEAKSTCSKNGARLITENDYDGLYNVLQDNFFLGEDTEAYWVDLIPQKNREIKARTSPSVKNMKWKSYKITDELPVICKKPVVRIDAVARIYPEELDSFPSSEKWTLTCKVTINGEEELSSQLIKYQWMKNGFPLSRQTERTIRSKVVEDETKLNFLHFDQQGSYQCRALIAGFTKYVTSQQVEIYFTDTSTYAITLGREDNIYSSLQDRSRPGFQTVWEPIEQEMMETAEDFRLKNFAKKNKLKSIEWSFQNISISNIRTEITLLFYLGWSTDDTSERSRNENGNHTNSEYLIEEVLRKSIETNLKNSGWETHSVSLNRADVCSEEETNGIKWLQTSETKKSISDPLCLYDSMMLKRRICYRDLNKGAHWQKDPITCDKTQAVFDQKNLMECPVGYKPFVENFCYKIYETELTWEEAFSACNEDYAYLYSDDYDFNWYEDLNGEIVKTLDDLREFWVAGKKLNGLFQWIGMAPRILTENNRLKWEEEEPKIGLDCVSLSIQANSSSIARSKDCSERKKFVCIQYNMELSQIPSCDENWVGSVHYDKCFLMVKEKKTWDEAQKQCESFNPEAHLLTLRTKTIYSLILKWMKKGHVYEESYNWWIGLQRHGEKYELQGTLQSELKFVDWSRNTKFTKENSVGGLIIETIQGEKSIKWKALPPSEENIFICEKKRLKDVRNASAEVKITNIAGTNKAPIYSCNAENSLHNSIIWYKDGIPIEGKQGIIWNEELNLEHMTSISSDPMEILRSQGYYTCSTEQEKPFQRAISLPVLHQIKGVQTFAVTMISTGNFTKQYQNMVKGNFLHSASELEKELGDIFKSELNITLKNITLHGQEYELLFHFYYNQRTSEAGTQSEEFKKEFIEDYFRGKCSDKLCSDIENWIESNYIKRENIEVKHTVCPKDVTITSMNVTLTWPTTTVGESSFPLEDCLIDGGRFITRRCLGNFNTGAYWDDVHGNCRKDLTLQNLAKKIFNEENVVESTIATSSLSSPRLTLNSSDVILIAKIMNNIANVSATNSTIIEESAKVVDNLLLGNRDVLKEAQNQNNSLNNVTDSLERILLNSDVEEKNVTVAYSKVAVQALKLSKFNDNLPIGVTTARAPDSTLNVTNLYKGSWLSATGVMAGILLPVDLVENRSSSAELKFIIYEDPLSFRYNGRLNDNFVINSPIIFAYIGSEPVRDLKNSIQMIMEAHNASLVNENRTYCNYLVKTNNGSNRWSDEGCSFVKLDNNRYRCDCNHLTNFAVLTDINNGDVIEEHEITLSIITYVGCGLSTVGLTLTILTFLLFKKSRKGNKQQSLCNLSVALLIVMFLFMFGINRNEPKLGCIIIAVLLHYFLLVSFCWMLVEAVLQYLNFVKVLSTYVPRFMRKAMIFAWGFPGVIVTIVLSIDNEQYDSHKKYCWISRDGFIFAFILPVTSLLITNFAVFGLIIFSICKRPPPGLQINQSKKKLAITRLRAAICISFLLGLSWLLGFLAVHKARLVLQYFFAVTTTIQGFIIFIFSVAQDKASRQLWFALLFKPRNNGHRHTTQTQSSDNSSLAVQGRRIKVTM